MKRTFVGLKLIAVFILYLSLAGCAGSMSEGDPLWKVPIVSKEGCLSIDGRYFDRGHLGTLFSDGSKNYDEPQYSWGESFKKRPYFGLPAAQYYEAIKKFDSELIVSVKRVEKGWDISNYGSDGAFYGVIHVLKDHVRVGCDAEGRLVLREFSFSSVGAELTPGSASAGESVFRRLADGRLEVQRFDRDWVSSMNKPPRKDTSTIVYFMPAP